MNLGEILRQPEHYNCAEQFIGQACRVVNNHPYTNIFAFNLTDLTLNQFPIRCQSLVAVGDASAIRDLEQLDYEKDAASAHRTSVGVIILGEDEWAVESALKDIDNIAYRLRGLLTQDNGLVTNDYDARSILCNTLGVDPEIGSERMLMQILVYDFF